MSHLTLHDSRANPEIMSIPDSSAAAQVAGRADCSPIMTRPMGIRITVPANSY
jgi:hypothetical protein